MSSLLNNQHRQQNYDVRQQNYDVRQQNYDVRQQNYDVRQQNYDVRQQNYDLQNQKNHSSHQILCTSNLTTGIYMAIINSQGKQDTLKIYKH